MTYSFWSPRDCCREYFPLGVKACAKVSPQYKVENNESNIHRLGPGAKADERITPAR